MTRAVAYLTMSTENQSVPSNDDIRQTIEKHLPKAQNSELWDKLTTPLAVVSAEPIDLGSLWRILNTTVSRDKIVPIWESLNRPIEWEL